MFLARRDVYAVFDTDWFYISRDGFKQRRILYFYIQFASKLEGSSLYSMDDQSAYDPECVDNLGLEIARMWRLSITIVPIMIGVLD